jgi:hypothetical protein
MANIRTSRRYAKLPDAQLSDFAAQVIAGLTGSTSFPTPPVLPAALTTLRTTFDNAIVAAATGGSMETAVKNAARVALLAALNKDASYVDINCNDDLSTLLSSGFEAASTNRAQTVLDAPQIVAVDQGQSGELKVRVKGDPNAKSYVGRIKQASGSEFGPSISFQNSKSILFDGLTAGVSYVMRVCAIGGSTGQSDWSETGPNMAM